MRDIISLTCRLFIQITKVPWWRCRRYWLSALLFVGFAIFSVLRANLSIIIVCMVKHGGHQNQSHVSDYNTSYVSNTTGGLQVSVGDENSCSKNSKTETSNNEDGEFEWDKELQGILLGGYFWGYSCGFQVLGGWLAQRYGARKIITFGLLPLAIGSLLSPVAVRVSPYLFLAIRIFSGASTGVMFPSAPVFWSRWSPPDEWSRLLSSSNAGGEFGHAIAFPINGLLCKYGGWELPFYAMGGVCLVWCLVWMMVSRDSPSQMPGITEAEKHYIETSIGERVTSHRTYKTPWCSIFRSRPVWACVCTHASANFFFYMVLTQGPTYLSEVMNFNITSNGIFSSLPYMALVLLIMPVGALSDRLSSRGYLSLGIVRKLMNTIGMVIPAIMLMVLAYLPCSDQTAGVALLTAAVGAFAFCFSGHIVNMADVALMHSGTLAGFSNTLASLPGIIAPYVVAYVTKQGTQEEWRTAFIIAVVMNMVGATVFLFFSSGVPQPWALPQELNMTTTPEVMKKVQEDGQDQHSNFILSSNGVSDSHRKEIGEVERLILDGREAIHNV